MITQSFLHYFSQYNNLTITRFFKILTYQNPNTPFTSHGIHILDFNSNAIPKQTHPRKLKLVNEDKSPRTSLM